MKARLLKKILNNTDYNISNHEEYIAIGSGLCHDLFKVDKNTLNVKYALDTFREGRSYLIGKSNRNGEDELLFIWDKLHELIESGEIYEIIKGRDEIENPLPVFTVKDGELVESVTDFYGWPNIDDNGICMYDNTHFPTKEEAIEYGIEKYQYALQSDLENIERVEKELQEKKERLQKHERFIQYLKSIKTS